MGMDLVPRRGADRVHYNWSGWRALSTFLEKHGLADIRLAGSNDGEYLRSETCKAIADAIENNAPEYESLYGGTPKEQGGYGDSVAAEHAKAWRESGGMRQY